MKVEDLFVIVLILYMDLDEGNVTICLNKSFL